MQEVLIPKARRSIHRRGRRAFVFGLVLASLSVSRVAKARTSEPFDNRIFEATRSAGTPMIVHVTAPWCGVCQRQKPLVAAMLDRPEMARVVALGVDFDGQRDVVRALQVQHQSTIIVFGTGGRERGRAVGITDPAAIETLLLRALT